MKRKIIFIAISLSVLIGLVFLINFKNPRKKQPSNKIKIAATIFPIYDITKNIVGDKIDVNLIIPPGASEHYFEFTPQQIVNLQNTKAIFAIGYGLDDWAWQASKSVGANVYKIDSNIELRKSFENNGSVDPHFWLNIPNAEKIAANIYNIISEIDPENKDIYQKNSENYIKILSDKNQEFILKLKELNQRKIITFHDAWYYFADNFNLEIAGTFEPASGEEPTPKYLIELQNVIKNNSIKTIFSEPQLSSNIIDQFVKDLNLKVFILDPVGGIENRDSYIKLMEYNTDILAEALK